mgnify:CR=1 FL=1
MLFFFATDYIGAVIAFLVLALLCHFVAFIAALVNGCRKGDPFPVLFVGILFIVACEYYPFNKTSLLQYMVSKFGDIVKKTKVMTKII